MCPNTVTYVLKKDYSDWRKRVCPVILSLPMQPLFGAYYLEGVDRCVCDAIQYTHDSKQVCDFVLARCDNQKHDVFVAASYKDYVELSNNANVASSLVLVNKSNRLCCVVRTGDYVVHTPYHRVAFGRDLYYHETFEVLSEKEFHDQYAIYGDLEWVKKNNIILCQDFSP
jgi:hypothetical protein